MVERTYISMSHTNCISVEFNDPIFNLEFTGCYNEFVNNFIPMFKDFANGVIEQYLETVRQDPDKRYRECLAEWYAETTLVDYPDRFRKEKTNDQN